MKSSIFLCCLLGFLLVKSTQQAGFDYTNLAIVELYVNKVREFLARIDPTSLTKCHSHLLNYTDQLLSLEPNTTWAKNMFDANTKVPSGILNGNLVDYGTFDQCMAVYTKLDKDDVYGKYCLASVPIGPLLSAYKMIFQNTVTAMKLETKVMSPQQEYSIMFATCLPSTCSNEEIQTLYNSLNLTNVEVKIFDQLCQSKLTQPKLNGGDIAVISFLSVVAALMVSCTIYDVFLYFVDKKPAHLLLIAFSVLENGRKLFKVTNSPSHISCLHGIRVITMMWIVMCHRYYQAMDYPLQNTRYLTTWIYDELNLYILGATVSVDTFLLLSGLVVGYGFMCMIKAAKFNIFVFYLHRYLRLTPVLAVVVLFYMTLFRHLGSGPMWLFKTEILKNQCDASWWATLLYVQNYAKSTYCIGQSWYLSVDTQLYIISPLILIPLSRWPKVGYIIIAVLTFLSILATFLAGWFYKFYGFFAQNVVTAKEHYVKGFYAATHTRAAPWFIGIALGYYIYQLKSNKRRIVLNKALVVILWALTIGVLVACVFTGHNLFVSEDYNRFVNALYLALLRPGWALAVGTVIFLCVLDYGGPINWFLSAPIFQVLSKLTYTMYLIHMAMQIIMYGQDRTVMYLRDLNMLHAFWGDYMFTLCTSVLFTLAFESPIITIEKFIFTPKVTKQPLETGVKLSLENGFKRELA